MQRVVHASRAQSTVKQLQGFNIDSSSNGLKRSLTSNGLKRSLTATMIPKMTFISICSAHSLLVAISMQQGIFFTSIVFRQIATRWVCQLNADATFWFCRNAVDMIGFGVNSVGSHIHPLCWSIIPHQTEGELTYTSTYTELEEAFILSCGIRTCDSADCTSCVTLKKLRAQERTIKHLDNDAFKAGRIPVDTAQCDSILGFGNFTRAVFNMDPNVCKCHPLGDYSFHTHAADVWSKIFIFTRGGQLFAQSPFSVTCSVRLLLRISKAAR
jgi:hypothetical protein